MERLKELAEKMVKDAARKVTQELDEPPMRAYHVCYRIAEDETEQGSYEDRYTKLTGRIKDIMDATVSHNFEDRSHVSTSVWLVRARWTAEQMYEHLFKGALTTEYDVLEITEVDMGNRKISPRPSKTKSRK